MLKLIALTCILLTLGCSSITTPNTGDRIQVQLSPKSVLIKVPGVKNSDNSCGLDCLTSLLRFHKLDIDDAGIKRFPLDKINVSWTSAGEIRSYLVSRGFKAYLVHGSLDDKIPTGLFYLLDQGLPVIVQRSIHGQQHFNLVCGYEPERHLILYMLPEGIGAVTYEKFELSWSMDEHLMLVAAPKTELK